MNHKLFTTLRTPSEMSRIDSLAVEEYGLPGALLMENASREAFRVLEQLHGVSAGLKVLVLAGGGNNGGDGIALARHLHNAGCLVKVYCTIPLDGYTGMSRQHLQLAQKAGVHIQSLPAGANKFSLPQDWNGEARAPSEYSAANAQAPDIIIDALVGAGFKAPLRGGLPTLIRQINSFKDSYIYSLDLPSGLGALSGLPENEAVRADATVTFATLKPGLVLPAAWEYTGKLAVRDIGLPKNLLERERASYALVKPQEGILPKQPPLLHKGSKGKTLVIGGSAGLTGAPHLSALGALRTGGGLATVAAPAGLCDAIKAGSPEVMTLPLSADWNLSIFDELAEVIAKLGGKSALVLGPGMGRTENVALLIEAVVAMPERPPLVLDADGLFPFGVETPAAKSRLNLDLLREDDVITPHPGEMFRLLQALRSAAGCSGSPDLQNLEARASAVLKICETCPATVILKGPGTLIARRETPVCITPFAEANLAVGGSGDILAGVVAALLARGLHAFEAACLGAHIHGRAGMRSRWSFPAGGALASDIASCIPNVLHELE